MKSYNGKLAGILAAVLMLVGLECGAATHYVVPPGTAGAAPADPYTNWVTAGTNIIDVVNAAMTNTAPRVVWVTNGTYYPTNRITGTNTLTFQSVNGRNVTIFNGTQNGNRRFMNFTAGTLTFDGFTVTNFHNINDTIPNGLGGVISGGGTIRNCTFANNTNYSAAIIFAINTITNSIFRNNTASGAAVLYINHNNTIRGCLFEGNRANYTGAVDLRGGNNSVSDCVFVNNQATSSGVGALSILANNRTPNIISNCTFIGNSAAAGYAGAIYVEGDLLTNTVTIRNCLIASNSASTYGGGIYLKIGTNIVESCTIVSNYAGISGGGLYVSTNMNAAVGTNNIIYHNTAASAPNYTNATIGNAGLDYSCVYPEVAGTSNTTNDPGLVNLGGGNYRLGGSSPCVNAGANQNWMTGAVDLDGMIRIRYDRVDMGAYECIIKGTIFKIR